ncbi:MAG: AI-2E family transporter [Thermoguttaceae bacterium]
MSGGAHVETHNGKIGGGMVIAAAAIAFAALVFFLWWARHVLFLGFAGLLLAVFLQSLGMWAERFTRLPYSWSLTLATTGLIVIIALFSWLIGARLSQQFDLLNQELPASFEKVWSQFWGTSLGKTISKSSTPAGQSLLSPEVLKQAAGVTGLVMQFVADAVIVVFVGLYAAAQREWYRRGFLRLIPIPQRPRAEQVIEETVRTVRWWLLGQVAAMIAVGVLTGFGLWLIGIKLPIALGVLAFMLEIIPYLGPFLALIPAVLLAWVDHPLLAVWVLVVFAIVHIVESYLIMPLVQLRAVHMPPALHLLTLVVLTSLGGLWGVLVTGPAVVVGILLVRMLYVEDVLGDSADRTDTIPPLANPAS